MTKNSPTSPCVAISKKSPQEQKKQQHHIIHTPELHQKQYPFFYADSQQQTITTQFQQDDAQLLHFGFASEEEIAKKYFTYRENGQTGWALDRLVGEGAMLNPQENEEQQFTLKPVLGDWLPEFDGKGEPESAPEPIFSPERMMLYGSYEQWAADQ